MGLIALIVAGVIIGVLARLLMPGRDPIGILGTVLVGIVGAIVGGYAWRALFGNTEGFEIIGGVLVAMVLLYAYRRMSYGRGAA